MSEPLSFVCKVDLVIDGRACPPSLHASLAEAAKTTPPRPGDVTGYFLAAWVGADSREYSLARIGPDGTAPVRLRLQDRGPRPDVDTIKFAVCFNSVSPKGTRNDALASSFLPVSELADHLSAGGGDFAAGGGCLRMQDNFSKNVALLRFRNVSTSLAAVRRLKLRPSALRELKRTGAAVVAMGDAVRAAVGRFAVSPLNAGPQYMDAFTYWHMEDALCNYAIMGHLMSKIESPIDLPWLMYSTYQAVLAVGLDPRALLRLPPHELAMRFGPAIIACHVGCALTNVYSTDYTVTCAGRGKRDEMVVKLRETEDIARTFSSTALHTQGLADRKPFEPSGPALAPGPQSLAACVEALLQAQRLRRDNGLAERLSQAAIADDCENLSAGALQVAQGLCNLYVSLRQKGGPAGLADAPTAGDDDARLAARLAERMAKAAAADRRFARLTPAHHALVAPLIVALGRMLHTGEWDNSFTVCSTKGPSYNENSPDSCSDLCGHGTVLASVATPGGGRTYWPVECTAYFRADPAPPPGYADALRLRGQNGSDIRLSVSDALTVIAQNVHFNVGMSQDCCLLAHTDVECRGDPTRTPFYVAAFYTGAQLGPRSLGCVPIDTAPPPCYKAGNRPLFGAPVMAMSRPTTKGLSVGLDMLADTPEHQDEIYGLLTAQLAEMYSPASDKLGVLGSYWQPCEPPSALPPPIAGPFGQAECTWAFDHPDHTAMAVAVCKGLAQRFNELQQQDPRRDGVVAYAFGKFLSAALVLRVPIPRSNDDYSCTSAFKNLCLAARQTGADRLTACPVMRAHIGERAKVESDHQFYMCNRGQGPVHAFRVRLA